MFLLDIILLLEHLRIQLKVTLVETKTFEVTSEVLCRIYDEKSFMPYIIFC